MENRGRSTGGGRQHPVLSSTAVQVCATTRSGRPIIASDVLDRLLRHSGVLNIRGESCRHRGNRQAGLFSSHQVPGGVAANGNDNYHN